MKRSDLTLKKINSVLSHSRNSQQTTTINYEGRNASSSPLANSFNDFFIHQFSDTRSGCYDSGNTALNVNTTPVFLSPTDVQEVRGAILNLNNSGTCDVDNLQIRPVKFVADLITFSLAHIFNLYLSSATFPQKMQV